MPTISPKDGLAAFTSSNRRFLTGKDWIDTLNSRNQWRVHVMQQRSRTDPSTGAVTALPLRVRRFAEGCPPAAMKEAMDYLLSLAPYTGVMFNGQPVDGEYRPTMTQWKRDDSDVINSPSQKRMDGTYTLVQDLLEKDVDDSYGAGSSDSCTEETVTEWHWDEASIQDLPVPTQGVSWAIAGVQRDDSGTFSYSLVKRVAKTQVTGPVVTKDNASEAARVTVFRNLYGDPVTGWTDDAGNHVHVPAAGLSDGVSTEVSPSRNEDCTYNLTVTETRQKALIVSSESTHDQYRGTHEKAAVGDDAPLENAPDSSNGVIKKHSSTKQPDGRYAVKVETVKERRVDASRESWRVGLHGLVHTVVDTNVGSPGAKPLYTRSNIGTSVETEKTPGRLFTVTTTSYDRSDVTLRTSDSCDKTVFIHKHSDMSTQATGDVSTGHVENAGGGKYYSSDSRLTDDGAVVTTSTSVDELPVSNASVSVSRTAKAVTRTITHRNVSTSVAPTSVPSDVGTELSHRMNDGGSYDYTVRTVDVNTSPDRAASSNTVYMSTVDRVSLVKGTAADSSPARSAGGSHFYSKNSDLNDFGVVTTVERDNHELEYRDASVEVSKTLRGTITRTTDRNVSGTPGRNVPGKVGATSFSVNDGGSYNVTVTEYQSANCPDSGAASRTIYEERRTSVNVDDDGIDDTNRCKPVSVGTCEYEEITQRIDETFGTRYVSTTTVREDEVPESVLRYQSDHFSKRKVTTDANVRNPELRDSEEPVVELGSGKLTSREYTVNPGGSVTYTKTETEATAREWEDPEVECLIVYRRTWYCRNYQIDKYKEKVNALVAAFKAKINGWIGDNRGPSHVDMVPRSTLNEYGLIDATVNITANWSPDSAGLEGPLDKVFTEKAWTAYTIQQNFDRSPGSDVVKVTVTKIAREHEMKIARGIMSWDNYMANHTRVLEGFSVNFSPSTTSWSAHNVRTINAAEIKKDVKMGDPISL